MDGVDLSKCVCEAGAVEWIRDWFQDCVYSRWDLLSFLVGLASIGCWLVAQLPQFIQNIRVGSADALSPWFLFQWLSGDLLNLLGCLLSGSQLITQTFTAIYFIFADCCIIAQLSPRTRRALSYAFPPFFPPSPPFSLPPLSPFATTQPTSSLPSPHRASPQYVYYQLKNRDSLELDADCMSRAPSQQDGFIAAAAFSSPSAALRRPLLSARPAAPADHADAASSGAVSRALSVVSPPKGKLRRAVEEIRALENELPYREVVAGGAAAATAEHESHVHRQKQQQQQQQQHRHEHHNYHPVSFLAGRSGAVLLAHAWQGPHLASDPRPPSLPPPQDAGAVGAEANVAGETDVAGRADVAGKEDVAVKAVGRRLNAAGRREQGAGARGDGRGRLLRIAEEGEGRADLFPVASDNTGGGTGGAGVAGACSRRRATADEAGGAEGRRGGGQAGRVQFEEQGGKGGEGAGGEGRRRRAYSGREVRRVVEQYGLEHGPPLLHARLTIHHHPAAPAPSPAALMGGEQGQAGGMGAGREGHGAAGVGGAGGGHGREGGAPHGEGGHVKQEGTAAEGTGASAAVASAAATVPATTGEGPSEGGNSSGGGAAGPRPQKAGALSLLLGSLMLLALASSALNPADQGDALTALPTGAGPCRGGKCSRAWWGTGEVEAAAGRKLLAVQARERQAQWHQLRGERHAWQQQAGVEVGRARPGNSTLCLLHPHHPNCRTGAAAARADGGSAVSDGGSLAGREAGVVLQLLPPVLPLADRLSKEQKDAGERGGRERDREEGDAEMAACRAERKRRRKEPSKFIHQLGLMLGWVSAGFYLGSRVSQIWQNAERGSAEGLSMAMFLCAFCGNLTYGTAILLRAPSLAALSGNLPWLVGSMGTLSLDITIYLQAQFLSCKKELTSVVRPITVL
ncbi:unnamed protein product [Closterium sp. NIES-65]|nr:unnamed protein product [Closterium sp. NIES-65]